MEKKYIIELKDNTAWLQWVNVVDDGTVYFDYKYPEDLTPYTEPELEQVRKEAFEKGYSTAVAEQECAVRGAAEKGYQKGYETGYKDGYHEPGKNQQEAYQRGLNDAWECMKKITHIVTDQGTMIDMFGCRTFGALLEQYTPGECIEKIQQYKQEKEEIQVGDEYCYAGKYRCVITEITDNFYRILWDNGTSTVIGELTYIKPTGRHFPEIAEVLAKMKEADNVID